MENSASPADRHCKPCEGKETAMSLAAAENYRAKTPGWILAEDGKSLRHEYAMKNFMAAVEFINQVAGIAESENHHPDIHLERYRSLTITLSTHAVGGLSENDFTLAAKINALRPELKLP